MRVIKGSTKIPIGQTYRRKTVYLDLGKIPHTKIAGVTGSGKSEALKTILYFLCNQLSPKQLHIHIIDLKGGATFAAFALLPHVKGVYANTSDALLAMCYCEDEMWQRLEMIREARQRFERDPRFPLLVLVIDEGGELSPADSIGYEKKLRAACMETLSSLVRVGREPGIRVIYGTQRPDRYTLPMVIRSQLENTLCFRVMEDYDSKIVIGHDGAEELPHIPGRMIFKTPDGEVPCQSTYIPPDVMESWLRQYSGFIDIPLDLEHLRQKLEDKVGGGRGRDSTLSESEDIDFRG